MQRRNIALQAAIGLDGDEAALRAETAALRLDDADVVGVQLRDDHRHIRRPAVRGIVGDDGTFEPRIALLQCADLVLFHVHGAEHEIDHGGELFCVGLRVENGHFRRLRRDGLRHVPFGADGLTVGLACAVRTGGQSRQLEPRMRGDQKDKALTDHAGRADDADLVFFHCFRSDL